MFAMERRCGFRVRGSFGDRTGDRSRAAGTFPLLVALFGLLTVPAAPLVAQEWTGPAAFEVQVDDERGRPVAGAEVVLAYAGLVERPAPVRTDSKGRASVGGLAAGAWSIEVRHAGHMTFRGTILLGADAKPVIESAAQHNVPGAVAPMRIRFGRARGAVPAAKPLVQAAALPASAAPAAAPVTAAPAPDPVEAPSEGSSELAAAAAPVAAAPAPTPPPARSVEAPAAPSPEQPAVATPAPAPPPARSAEAPAPPSPKQPAVGTPAPTPPPARSAEAPAEPSPKQPAVATPAPTPPPARSAEAPGAPEAPAPLAPVARTCHECGPGEQALWTEVRLVGPGGCGDALRAELAGAAVATLPERLRALPAGCAVLRVDVPRGMRYLGFRYEAASPGGRSTDCFPDRPCAAGGCRFAGEPILLREGSDTAVLAFFEVEGAEPRTGGLTVYYSSARRRP